MRILGRFSLALMISSLGACAVVSSHRVGGLDSVEPSSQAAGSYFLAKHNLKVTVFSDEISIEPVATKDIHAMMQVGLNLSPTSDDNVKVEYQSNGLLKKITTIADDKSGEIIKEVARAVGYFRTTRGAAAAARTPLIVVSFDPFDYAEALVANRKISERLPGSCVEVELASGLWSPGCGRRSLGRPSAGANHEYSARPAMPPSAAGIYYRRPMAHRVHVMTGGRTRSIEPQLFANLAPIMRVDIDRTLFVKRETTVTFSAEGALDEVHVVKPSEGLAIAKLPIAVAQAVIGGVVEAISDHKKVQDAQAALLDSQAKLIEKEAALLEAQAKAAAKNGTAPGLTNTSSAGFPGGRSAGFQSGLPEPTGLTLFRAALTPSQNASVAACLNTAGAGMTPAQCEEYVRRYVR
jgi:hypothetical protein